MEMSLICREKQEKQQENEETNKFNDVARSHISMAIAFFILFYKILKIIDILGRNRIASYVVVFLVFFCKNTLKNRQTNKIIK